MGIQEIVAVIVDSTVMRDIAKISALKLLGHSIQYISRHDARERATLEPFSPWLELSKAETIYLRQGKELFRAV